MALAANRPASKLLIVIGGNGAGKSTWCRENRGNLPTNFYNADWIAAGLGDWNSPSKQLAAGRIVIRAIAENLDRGADFGFESTYSGRSGPAIVRRAKARGYAVYAVFIGTGDPAINIRRIACRVANRTGHDVPAEVIRRRWAASMENLIVTADAIDTPR